MNPDIRLTADADIQAADQRTPTVRILAYSGGPIDQPWSDTPIYIDLATLRIPDQRLPLRLNHDPDRGIGHTDTITTDGRTLVATGLLSRDNEATREVIASARRGFPWRASIGAKTLSLTELAPNQKTTLNGREITGPALVAQAELREISLVDLPADMDTAATIAAHRRPTTMQQPDPTTTTQDQPTINAADQPTQTPAPPAADPQPAQQLIRAAAAEETTRIAEIRRIAAEHPDIAAQAIRDGWDAGRTALAVLRASRPPTVIQTYDQPASTDLLACAILRSAHADEKWLERKYGPQTVLLAERRWPKPLGLGELILEAAWANGYTGRSTRDWRQIFRYAFTPEICAGGFSTVDLPTIFQATANKFLLDGFNSVEQTWRNVSAQRAVKDFKTVTSYRLIGRDQYERVPPGGALKHGTLGERSYTNKADTYGLMLVIDRQDIINDDLDALSTLPRKMGAGAGRTLNRIFWDTFLADSAFFTSANGNLLTGASSALGLAGLTAAAVAFAQFKDDDGQYIGHDARILLTPVALQATAGQLFNSTEIRDNTTNRQYPVSNPHAGKYRPESSRYLDAASSTAWYLLADPAELAAIEVAFLNGQQSPTIETVDPDPGTLGIVLRGYHDFGVALQEPKAAVKSTGA